MSGSQDGPPLLRPIPRRPFDLNLTGPTPPNDDENYNASTDSPVFQPSPDRGSGLNLESLNSRLLDPRTNRSYGYGGSESTSISRAQSIMNLTSSTLYGIYSPTVTGRFYSEQDEPSTPWGTGAETPARKFSLDDPHIELQKERAHGLSRRRSSQAAAARPLSAPAAAFHLGLRALVLFGLGMGYGLLVSRLQSGQRFASLNVEEVMRAENYDWGYMAFWGAFGVVLGGLLPWFDGVWEGRFGREDAQPAAVSSGSTEDADKETEAGTDWSLVIRGVGAFVGIVFAIRKLPWASTLQVSLTLALVNPFLWYLIDRSKPGFLLSAAVGLTGSAILMGLKPDMVPAPPSQSSMAGYANHTSSAAGSAGPMLLGGLASQETVETGIWILSVLFCYSICFGNIGRRLALNRTGATKGRWAGLR